MRYYNHTLGTLVLPCGIAHIRKMQKILSVYHAGFSFRGCDVGQQLRARSFSYPFLV